MKPDKALQASLEILNKMAAAHGAFQLCNNTEPPGVGEQAKRGPGVPTLTVPEPEELSSGNALGIVAQLFPDMPRDDLVVYLRQRTDIELKRGIVACVVLALNGIEPFGELLGEVLKERGIGANDLYATDANTNGKGA